jgi:two-component system NtrC family sensor kinase
VENYAILTEKLSKLYREEKESIELMRQTARRVQSFAVNLSRQERADIDIIFSRATGLLIVAHVVVIFVGSFVNIKIATSIAMPIQRLEKISRKIAAGDFSERIEVKGKDELASLEAAFNHMEEKLQNALWSLEHAIEKLREKQAQLVEAEKLAAIGKLAAGIAHEINNPLTSVLTFSNLMLEQCDEGDPRRDRLKLMARETERGTSCGSC